MCLWEKTLFSAKTLHIVMKGLILMQKLKFKEVWHLQFAIVILLSISSCGIEIVIEYQYFFKVLCPIMNSSIVTPQVQCCM